MQSIATWTTALLLTTIAIALLRPLAARIGLIDRPSSRKNHNGDVPLVGGIAIALALPLTFLVVGGGPTGWKLVVACIAMVVIGVNDEELSACKSE